MIWALLLLQDPDALRAKIAGAAGDVYSIEGSSIGDLEIRVSGRWGDLELGDLNRRVYGFNAGAECTLHSGNCIIPITRGRPERDYHCAHHRLHGSRRFGTSEDDNRRGGGRIGYL